MRGWYLLGRSASKDSQRELLRFFLGYCAEKLRQEMMCCFRTGVRRGGGGKFQATPTKKNLDTS